MSPLAHQILQRARAFARGKAADERTVARAEAWLRVTAELEAGQLLTDWLAKRHRHRQRRGGK